jgi:hypothetical protein
MILASSVGETSWTNVVYPQFQKSTALKTAVAEAVRMYAAACNQESADHISVTCDSETKVKGVTCLGLFMILQGLNGTKSISISCDSDNTLHISHSGRMLTDLYVSASSQFIHKITQKDRFIVIEL